MTDVSLTAYRAGLVLAANHFFHAGQILRQSLPARMRLAFARGAFGDRLALRFGFHFVRRHAGLFVGQ